MSETLRWSNLMKHSSDLKTHFFATSEF
jgi:hypothetical protein